MTNQPLRILLIEDVDDDALLMMREVKREYSDAIWHRVDTVEALIQTLTDSIWDIALSDYVLPSFNALDTLRLVQERDLDLPVIIVSGTVDEETAVMAMKAGAVDYFPKDKMQRLVPAIQRELREAQNRRMRRQAEAELRLKNRALEASPVGVMITDPTQAANPIIYVNAAFESITGYSPAEVIGRGGGFLHGEDIEQPGLNEIRDAIRENRECNVILRNYRKDGTLFWNQVQIAPLFDPDGRLVHYVDTMNDITAQKIAEDEVRSLYSATSILFQSTNLVDLSRGITETVVREFKYADTGIMLLDDTREKLIRMPRSGDLAITPTIELLVEGSGLVPSAVRTGEVTYAPDVSQHPDYKIGSSSTQSELVIPLKTPRGLIGVMDLQSDRVNAFSEQDQRLLAAYAEHAAIALENIKLIETVKRYAAVLEWRVIQRTSELERAKSQVEAILNNVGDAIIVLNSQGKIIQANPVFESLFGYPRDSFVQEFLADSRLFVNTTEVAARIQFVSAFGVPHRGEFQCLTRSGQPFDVEVVFAPVPGDDPDSVQVVCSIRDVSTQKQLEVGLRQAVHQANELVELKARFFSMISHEFRTPLSVILMSAETLSYYADKLDAQGRQDRLDNIQGQVKLLTQLSDGAMLLGQAETVGMVYQAHDFDLSSFCEETVTDMQSISRKRHQLHFASSECSGMIHADDKLLGHILRNLLSNAIKYSPRGGIISVDLRCEPEQLLLTVKDEGIGIPENSQAHLFEMFHRADNVGSISGMGLGLSIVKHAVDAYHGSVTFTTAKNQGTTFYVTLPLIVDGENQPQM